MNVETLGNPKADPAEANRAAPRRGLVNWIYRNRWFGLAVVLPVLLAVAYYELIAADVYVSESRFVIKSPGQRQVQVSALASLIQSTGLTAGQEQANEVKDYLQSRNALGELQRRIDFRRKAMSVRADRLSRFPLLWDTDSFEDLYKFYKSVVLVRSDPETNAVVLEVRAFEPDDAHDINAQLLSLSEGRVNQLNDRAQAQAIAENTKRVELAEYRLSAARVALRRYRNTESLLDPGKQATGVLDVSNRLVGEQRALQAQLEAIERAAPANPSIPALRARIAAISRQAAEQNGKAVGTSTGIASKLTEYEKRATEQEFATQMVAAANTTLEQARTEAQRQQFYLERVVEPNRPDMALLPHRLRQILTIAAAFVCLYMIGWMLIVGILEHAPED